MEETEELRRAGRIAEDCFASVRTIGLVHSRVGLESRWCVGDQSFVIGGMIALAVDRAWRRDERLAATRIALDRAAALDMAVAVSAYQEARPGERAKRATAVGAAVGRFAADVDAVVRSVSTASGDMRTAAQSLSADAGDAARQAA